MSSDLEFSRHHYDQILNALNRSVLQAQPPDINQYCANWFLKELEKERKILVNERQKRDPNVSPFPIDRTVAQSRPVISQNWDFPRAPKTHIDPVSMDASHPPNGVEEPPADYAMAPQDYQMEPVDSPISPPQDNIPPPASWPNYPPNFYFGRRASVSAESLDPTQPPGEWMKKTFPKTPDQVARIRTAIANNILFKGLSPDQEEDIIAAMRDLEVHAGTDVVVQGKMGDYFYVVEKGQLEVLKNEPEDPAAYRALMAESGTAENPLGPPALFSAVIPGGEPKPGFVCRSKGVLGAGTSFGELALMHNSPRLATVRAVQNNTILWALDRVTFRYTIMFHAHSRRQLYWTFLRKMNILDTLSNYQIEQLADVLDWKQYEPNETVVREGEPGDAFFIIEKGTAQAVRRFRRRKDTGEELPEAEQEDRVEDIETEWIEKEVMNYSVGDYFGELALIFNTNRTATVRPKAGFGPLRCAYINKAAFFEFLGPARDELLRRAALYSPAPRIARSRTMTL